ncbi:hypothetical protein [Actinomadura sp. 9N407]|uniref:hypothetical protein n=1 Tax=Actinomadura sp. 9N407 TaxID=3375154 RepID=UPI00378E1D5E
MCRLDRAAKEDIVASFLTENPTVATAGCDHPALRGAAEVSWDELSCTAAMPALLGGLLDESVGEAALGVLTSTLMDGLFHVGRATPFALPFLIRVADDLAPAVRYGLVEWLIVVAGLCEPVHDENDLRVLGGSSEKDRPEWAQCRAVFREHAAVLRDLVDATGMGAGWNGAADLEPLLQPAPA